MEARIGSCRPALVSSRLSLSRLATKLLGLQAQDQLRVSTEDCRELTRASGALAPASFNVVDAVHGKGFCLLYTAPAHRFSEPMSTAAQARAEEHSLSQAQDIPRAKLLGKSERCCSLTEDLLIGADSPKTPSDPCSSLSSCSLSSTCNSNSCQSCRRLRDS